MTIGIIYIATGNYIEFFTDYYDSAEKNFIPEAKKIYFVFTDRDHPYLKKENVYHIPQHQEYWPYAVLHKFHYILEAQHLYKDVDFLYMTNANLKFLTKINANEILPFNKKEFIAVKGPWLYYNNFDINEYFEENINSAAYITPEKRTTYLASGFVGGKKDSFLSMAFTIRNWIEVDLSKNIFAKWEDQAYVNKFLLEKLGNTRILSPAYLYPEEYKLKNFTPKILVLYKQKKGGRLKVYYRKYKWLDENKKFKNKFQYYKHVIIYYLIKFLNKIDNNND